MIWLLLFIPVIAAFAVKWGRVRSVQKLDTGADAEVERRLEPLAAEVGGQLIDGPALKTDHGMLVMYASKAPKDFVIDSTKFTSAVPGTQQVTIARVEDAKKVIATKGLQKLTPEDPELAKSHLYFASDEAFGRRCMDATFMGRLKALDAAVRGRCRITLARGTATVWLGRGLSAPEELRAFYDGSADLMAMLRERVSG